MSWLPRPKDVMRAFLVTVLLGAFQVALFWLFQWEVPQTNRDLVVFMLGQLSGFLAASLGFYFNTSKSSADKNDLFERTVQHLPSGTPSDPVHTNEVNEPRPMPDPEFGFDDEKGDR